MQTIQEEDEHSQTRRAAFKDPTTRTMPVTESSSRNPDITNLQSTPAPKPAPTINNNIPEPRPIHLRSLFISPPSNLPPPSTTTTPSNRPIYDNQIPGIPTHWIPIYGAGHGLFYDPITKLFHNDGPPRPDLERSDGSMPEMDTIEPLPRFNQHREDCLHLQPRAVTDPLVRKMRATPIKGRRYYCRCQRRWMVERHDCPDDTNFASRSWSGGVPQSGRTIAVRPGDTIPASSFTHELKIGDLGYLTPGQRYAYENNLPMPRAAFAANESRAKP